MLLLLSLLACMPKSVETRITALETEVATLQDRVAMLEGDTSAAERREAEAVALYDQLSAAVAEGEVARAKELLSQLDTRFAGTRAQSRASRLRAELEVVGQPAVALDVQQWFQGYADITQGAWVVIFFEQWCPHCRREMPQLQQQLPAVQAEGFQVVAATKLTRTSTEDNTREMLASAGIAFAVAQVGDAAWSAYNVSGIPAAVVIVDGTAVWRGHPARINPDLLRALRRR